MKMKISVFMFFLALFLFSSTAYGNEHNTSDDTSHLAEGISNFAHAFFNNALKDYHIPGAVFVVVENGQVIFARGYGYADLGKRIPVDPQKTMFCAGSVGKLVNWTALMQLYEAGKFDLNDDLNLYLKNLHIPESFPEPVTFRHLLTHTPGFDDRNLAATPDTLEQLLPLEEYLAWTLPERLRPPGQVTQYSNHGAVLS